jgi:hypothetical protein
MSIAKKQKKVDITTFVLDGYVVTSPNAAPLSSFPTLVLLLNDDANPQDTFPLNWALPEYPQLAFILSPLRWDHPILQWLNYTFESVPVKHEYGWKLSPELAQHWENLEHCLSFVSQEIISATNPLFSLEFRYFPCPTHYGYLRPHRSEIVAQKCAMRACDAFAPLMAMCSLSLSFFHGATNPHDADPVWVKNILKSGCIHPEWIQQFRSSPIADFSGRYSRVGLITDVIAPHARVPVWLR